VATTTPLTIKSTINKRREVEGRGGGYGETARRGTRTCAHNNQTDHAEGGVVGDDYDDNDDDDGHEDDDDNDDDGGYGGRDGHHRMRKGRGHDDKTIKIDHRRGGGRWW
jgi:hypothetical protein